jgi:NADPH:quinone reductase-like Zn-dependent oxidoreductase/acyl carrier protein
LGNRFQTPAFAGTVFQRQFSPESPEYLNDHRIYSFVIAPGASHLAMTLCAAQSLGWEAPLVLEETSFPEALILPEDEPRTVQLIVSSPQNGTSSFRVMSCEAGKDSTWLLHAAGKIHVPERRESKTDALGTLFREAAPGEAPAADVLQAELTMPNLEEVQDRCLQHMPDARIFYGFLARGGVELGTSFQWLDQIWRREGEALSQLKTPLLEDALAPYQLHPGLIDSCIQLVAAGIRTEGHDYYAYIPVSLERFRFHRRPRGLLRAHVVHRSSDASLQGAFLGDLCLFDDEGLVAEMIGLRLQRAPRAALKAFAQRNVRGWIYRLNWTRSTPPPAASLPGGQWLIFADAEGVGERLAAELRERGCRCVTVVPGDDYRMSGETEYRLDPQAPEHFGRVLREGLSSPSAAWSGIVYLWSVSAPQDEAAPGIDAARFQAAQRLGSRAILSLVQRLAAEHAQTPPRLWLVTRGAVAVEEASDAESIDVAQAPVWGMARVVAVELPQLRCVRVDLDPRSSDASDVEQLFRELGSKDREDQIAYRQGERYTARLLRGTKSGTAGAARDDDGRPYQLVRQASGVIEELAWRPMARMRVGAGEFELAVRATGLNFRDVLNVLNLYPGEPGPLGFECAGTVTECGAGVEEFRPGDRVVAIAPGSFARFAIADARLAASIPDDMSFTAAATIPIVYLTAEIGLEEFAGLRAEDVVLIHSAAGGVGLAAIQVAKKVGAKIIATAGSEEKRQYVRALGVQQVFDSRSLDFARHVLDATEGRGVDVVINALPGDYVKKNLEALAQGGRFIEIGKSDLWNAKRVAEVRSDVSYHTLALDELVLRDPDLVAKKLRALLSRFSDGTYQTLPETVFPHEDVKDAFRYMAQAKHIGKVIVSQPEPGDTLNDEAGRVVRPEASYLITGGLGALGLLVSQWLVNQGAGHLMLVGRREPSDEALAEIETLRQQGAEIRVMQADVSRADDVERVFAAIDAEMPNLRGVAHAAGTIDDGVLLRQDWSRFESVMAPKALGALHLDRMCGGRDLDWFVMFSSAAALLGAPGQSNYAAANAALDALAHARRRRGEPGLSINWGAWSGAGMAARVQDVIQRQWEARGLGTITPSQGLATLAVLLAEPAAQVGVLPVDWSLLLQSFPPGTEPPLVAHLATSRRQSLEPNEAWLAFVEKLREAPPAERRDLLVRHMQEEAARVMGHPSPEAIDAKAPLTELGFDSLMAVEMANQLGAAAGMSLPTTLLFDYPNLEAMAGYILKEVLGFDYGQSERAPEVPAKSERTVAEMTDSLLASIEDLSDEEVADQLREIEIPDDQDGGRAHEEQADRSPPQPSNDPEHE